jgi:Mn-dependent DtxR family transcriptional regulator
MGNLDIMDDFKRIKKIQSTVIARKYKISWYGAVKKLQWLESQGLLKFIGNGTWEITESGERYA